MVPAGEFPVWREIYKQNPWDFAGLDKLIAHALFHIVGSNATLRHGVNIPNFMYPDPYRDGHLSEEAFAKLSAEEKAHYSTYAALSNEQYEQLDEASQHRYVKRLVANAKAILG